MTQISLPQTTVNISSAVTQVANQPQRILVVGQMTSAGTATSGALVTSIQNDNSWDVLFGLNSMLAGMIRRIRSVNDVTQIDAIPLDDSGSGVAATGTVVVVGTATEAGTVTVVTGSEFDFKVEVAVADGDTATVVGAAIEAAVNAQANVPVNAANVTGTVTMTAVNDGTVANDLLLSISGEVGGLTLTTTQMVSGATDPTLTGIFDVVGDTRYQGIVWPYSADTTEVRTFLDARFNVTNDVLDGVAFTAAVDSLANLQSTYSVLNSQSLLVIGDKLEAEAAYKGGSVPEIPMVIAAEFAAIRGLRLSVGASIANFVITRDGGLDSFGGPALASKPYFNTPLPSIVVTAGGRGWTQAEVALLKTDGVSVVGNNRAGNAVITGEMVTTYKTDTSGNPDISFTFLNFVDTASNAREFFFNNLRSTFAQSRLTSGDLVAGRTMANKQLIETKLIEFYSTLSGVDFVLTQAGETARNFFIQNLVVTLDLATGNVDITMKTPLVTQLRSLLADMQIVFSVDA